MAQRTSRIFAATCFTASAAGFAIMPTASSCSCKSRSRQTRRCSADATPLRRASRRTKSAAFASPTAAEPATSKRRVALVASSTARKAGVRAPAGRRQQLKLRRVSRRRALLRALAALLSSMTPVTLPQCLTRTGGLARCAGRKGPKEGRPPNARTLYQKLARWGRAQRTQERWSQLRSCED